MNMNMKVIMKVKSPPHLLPMLVAILLVVTGLSGGVLYAQSLERQYVHVLAAQLLRLNLVGSALQREAFRQSDLLPVYGSSEISDEVSGYKARDVFAAYSTGFAPFEVAQGGMTSLTMAQHLASLGPDLQGKKVIISFTPTMFVMMKSVNPADYNGLFSRLHANELAFSTQLSFATKQAAARRMLQYPTMLEKEPVLRFALERLADGSPSSRMLYYAVWPLGRLWTSVLELQDHWEALTYIWAHPQLNLEVPRQPAAIDWAALEVQAQREQEADADNNPYGIDNDVWATSYVQGEEKAQGSMDQAALERLQVSAEWTDLDILLRVLKEMGAQPLIMGRPVNAPFWEARGISSRVRQAYYDKLDKLVAQYGMPLVDFREHETDKYFSSDAASHSSRKGWVYVDKTMDQFFHGTLR